MRRLFCFSGGGFPGMDIHVGIWRALDAANIRATDVAGSSAGALVAALYAQGRSAENVDALLTNLRDADVRAEKPMWKLRIPWLMSFLNIEPLAKLLQRYGIPQAFGDLKLPLTVFATDEISGLCEEFFSGGDLRAKLLASCAINGVFDPVQISNLGMFSDGGATNNLAIPSDLSLYDEVYLLIAKRPIDYWQRTGILTRLMRNIDLLLEDQVNDAIKLARDRHPCVTVIRPPADATQGTLHFDHALIGYARFWTALILKGGKK